MESKFIQKNSRCLPLHTKLQPQDRANIHPIRLHPTIATTRTPLRPYLKTSLHSPKTYRRYINISKICICLTYYRYLILCSSLHLYNTLNLRSSSVQQVTYWFISNHGQTRFLKQAIKLNLALRYKYFYSGGTKLITVIEIQVI